MLAPVSIYVDLYIYIYLSEDYFHKINLNIKNINTINMNFKLLIYH